MTLYLTACAALIALGTLMRCGRYWRSPPDPSLTAIDAQIRDARRHGRPTADLRAARLVLVQDRVWRDVSREVGE